jgi:hypothetical protein
MKITIFSLILIVSLAIQVESTLSFLQNYGMYKESDQLDTLLQGTHYEDLESYEDPSRSDTINAIESDMPVYISVNCPAARFFGSKFTLHEKAKLRKIQRTLCNENLGLELALWYAKMKNNKQVFLTLFNQDKKHKDVEKILKNFIKKMKSTSEITYSKGSKTNCKPKQHAYVEKQKKLTILNLCPSFFSAPSFPQGSDSTKDTKFSILTYQLSLMLGVLKDQYIDKKTKKFAIGYNASVRLAKSNPKLAVKNASNYAYFIQAVYNLNKPPPPSNRPNKPPIARFPN